VKDRSRFHLSIALWASSSEGKNAEEAKNIKIHLMRSGSAVDFKLSHVPKDELCSALRETAPKDFRSDRVALVSGFLVEDISTSGPTIRSLRDHHAS
jgi:hypothetical protein